MITLNTKARSDLLVQIADRSGGTLEGFDPIEDEIANDTWSQPLPRPVEWYLLIREMEEFRRHTGMGLGGIWGHVSNGRYEAAREHMDELLEDWASGSRTGQNWF